jgi:hypothetical protein
MPGPLDTLRAVRDRAAEWFSPTLPANVQEGIRLARQELPDLGSVESYGPWNRLVDAGGDRSYGRTGAGGGIYLNQDTLANMDPQFVADTLTHEQEHVRQNADRGLMGTLMQQFSGGQGESYYRRPDEMGAFQAEKLRRARAGRQAAPQVDFTSGETIIPHDIHLK